jgi:maleylacetate reductase
MTGKTVNVLSQARVHMGMRATDAVEKEAQGKERVLIFSSATLQRDGHIAAMVERLGDRSVGVFTGLSEHTPLAKIVEAAALARDTKADLFVSIGGGSVIDGTKCVQAAVANGLMQEEEFAPFSLANPERKPLQPSTVRTVAVPTTLSGAEFTSRGGYTNPASGLKEGLNSADLVPQAVVLDAELALATPLDLWCSSGIRAVDHAVESLCSREAWPALKEISAAALTLLDRGLHGSKANPQDTEARAVAQQGVWLAAQNLENVVTGASHGLGYLLGTLGGVPHGMTSCLLLPAVMRWNLDVTRADQTRIAQALGAPEVLAADLIEALIADLGLATSFAKLGVGDDVIDRIAMIAMMHPVVRANPRTFATPDEVREFLKAL